MRTLKEIQLYCRRKVMESLRNPVFIFMGLASPIIYLALFSPLLKGFAGTMGFSEDNILDIFVPGMLSMMAFSNGLFAGWGIIDELRSGVIERFRVTPSSRFAILAGPVMRDLIAMWIQSVVFIVIAVPFGFHIHFLGLLTLFVLLSLLLTTTSAMAHAFGLITKSEDKLAPIVHGINLPITLLSGMLLPMSLAPTWLKVIAHFNPVFYVVEASRALVMGQIATPVVFQAFAVTIPLTLLVLRWSTNVFRRAVM